MVKVCSILSALLALTISPVFALTIDDFEGDVTAQATAILHEASDAELTPHAIGGIRSLKAHQISGGGRVTLETLGGTLNHSQDTLTAGESWVEWDGDPDPDFFNPLGFGPVNFLEDGGDSVRLTVYFDYPYGNSAEIALTFFSGSVWHSSSYLRVLDRAYYGEELTIPFAAFTPGTEGPVDWTKVTAVRLYVKGPTSSGDLTIDSISTNGKCVEVPDDQGHVLDDCGVCGGDNGEIDVCGECFGDGTSCADCAGVPHGGAVPDSCGVCEGNNSAMDICGVCFGDGKSCLDCAGVPHGSAVVDSCGVCGGNGSSCAPKCSEEDITPMLLSLKKKAKSQLNHNRTLIKQICTSKGKAKSKLAAQTQLYYGKMLSLVAKVPPKLLRCENVTECIKIDTYTTMMTQYSVQAKLQYKLSKQIIREKQGCMTGGICKRSAEECAKSAQRRNAQNQRDVVQGEKIYNDNKTTSAKVPCVTYVCPH